ncbi:hypothetical protein ACIGEP_15510 [Microbacterium sp. NPDC077663]|uniref:hypothetical protein n=1 Tax=Microbacterium sp. NPDC077663 TaxID=3364189 RepID=UPI0037C6BB54
MPTVAEHRATVEIEKTGEVFRIIDMSLGMDLEWTPFIQAKLTVPLTPDIDKLDPTAEVLWVTVRLDRRLGRTDTLADFTRRYRGRKVSAVSSDFNGDRLSAVTAATYHDYDTPGVEQTRTFRLIIETNEVDRAAARATLTLASAESLLLTDGNHGRDITMGGPTWGDVLTTVVARSGLTREPLGPFYDDPLTTTTPDNVNARWLGGASAWDFLQQQYRQRWDLFIYADEQGVIRLRRDRSTGNNRTLRSAGPERSVINEVFTASREDNWYEAVHVIWENARGIAYTGKRGPVLEIRRPGVGAPEPIPEQPDIYARKFLDNIKRRGDALELLAVSDYSLTPGDLGYYTTPRTNRRGRIVAVEWQWPQDEMSVRLREVETI